MWTEVIYSYIPIISPCLLVKRFFFAKLLGTKRRSVSMNSARVHPTKSRPLSSRGAWLKRWDRRLNLVKVFWDRTRRISHGWLRFHCHPLPIGSMYAFYGNIYLLYTPNVRIYTIHGSYGYIYTALSENRVLPTFMLSHHFTWLRTRFPVRGLSAFGIDKIPNSRWLLVQPPKYSSTNQPKNHSSNMFKNHFNPSEKWWS
jgi:hypothetical protein